MNLSPLDPTFDGYSLDFASVFACPLAHSPEIDAARARLTAANTSLA